MSPTTLAPCASAVSNLIYFMQTLVNQCLDLIVKDDVDEVVQALRDTYFWCVRNNFPIQESHKGVLDQFLDGIYRTLLLTKSTRE